jgi:hypothetical protein
MANDKGKKGFAGLDSMVSDVEVPKPRPAPAPEPVRQQEAPRPSAEPKPAYSPPKPSGGGAGKWWAIGIGVVVLFSWLGGSDKKSSARSAPTPSYSAPSYSASAPAPAAAPAYTPPVYVPEPAPVYATNDEEMPPVGSGQSLSRSQIRYCLSEKIRISAWQGQVNEYSGTSVDAFNEAVRDYNARCSNFRYRKGMLESVRSEVEANRYALQLDGMNRAATNP